RKENSWKPFLENHINELDVSLTAQMGELQADISPFTEPLSDEFMETFFSFPYRVRFKEPKLREATKQFAELARRKTPLPKKTEIESLYQKFRITVSETHNTDDLALVRAVLLFAWGKPRLVVQLADKYITTGERPNDDVAHELRFLKARSLVRLFNQSKKKKIDTDLLFQAKQDCEIGLQHEPKDARYRNVLGLVIFI
ncbi:MAG: hypothetical protein HW384_2218, partial [Dehalococcoidia bacterium]|nr:hypothetical protein [Dehalococcoidia bacterium]